MEIYKTHLIKNGVNCDRAVTGVTITTNDGLVARMAVACDGAITISSANTNSIAGSEIIGICYEIAFSSKREGTISNGTWCSEFCLAGGSVWMTARENNIPMRDSYRALGLRL